MGQLTVSQLIDLLKKQPQDALVWLEGNDEYSEASYVHYDPENHTVTIDMLCKLGGAT